MTDVKRILRLALLNGSDQKALLQSYERGFYCIRFDICDEQCEACYECGDSPYRHDPRGDESFAADGDEP